MARAILDESEWYPVYDLTLADDSHRDPLAIEIEIPDELVERWNALRVAWDAMQEELQAIYAANRPRRGARG